MSGAPVDVANPSVPHRDDDDDRMPRVPMTRRRLAIGAVSIVLLVAFMYYGLPRIAGFQETWERIEQGDPSWLALAAAFTALSFGGYVVLFHDVFATDAGCRISVRESYEITMAGLAATRIFAAGGAGGIALTAWALRRAGMEPRAVADRTIEFLVLTYVVYTAALVIVGTGLRQGLLAGPAPFAVTVVPAVFGAIAMGLAALLALTPTDLQRRLDGFAARGGRFARLTQRAANAPAASSTGIRLAAADVRALRPGLLGSIAFWGFNIAVLWASFRAFGDSPTWGVIIMGYFVGMLGNLLPLPGGVGGVDGGMIGAFLAFGVDSGLAVVAVLTYRAFAFWLPTIPGAIAFFQLRRTVARWGEERRHGAGPATAVARA